MTREYPGDPERANDIIEYIAVVCGVEPTRSEMRNLPIDEDGEQA